MSDPNALGAIILSIGDELMLGQTVDTNSAWIARQLAAVGIEPAAHVTVADDQSSIERALREALAAYAVLIASGGLGPTEDDLTRQALAAVMEAPLEPNEIWLKELDRFFKDRGRPMPAANRIQAMIPRGARMIFNHAGTAAGLHAQLPAANEAKANLFFLPGVPREMKAMFQHDVLPVLKAMTGGRVILSRTLHTAGVGESTVAEMLGDLMRRDRNPSVGTTAAAGLVGLRLNARFDDRAEAVRQLDDTEAACRAALGDLIYGRDEQTLQQVVGDLLKSRGQTVATAESCTGGLLAQMLTQTPGSSDYFHAGWVTYANDIKASQLGVRQRTLVDHGAVSEPVVLEMAAGARQRARADYALAISGVAGPDGGTPAKPVGTVCIGLAHPAGVLACTNLFSGDRDGVRQRSAVTALTMLRAKLLEKA